MKLIVTRRNGPDWVFEKTANGHYECKKRNTYRIMFGPADCKLVWIGMVTDEAILTWEKEINATSVVFTFGKYVFD